MSKVSEGAPSPWVESNPTGALRFVRKVVGMKMKTVLQQEWRVVQYSGSGYALKGYDEWRDVPEVQE